MSEHLLLVGGGGREHAIARAIREGIAERPDADEYRFSACASNRNPGIAALADEFRTLDETDPEAVADFATEVGATLAFVAPDDPLAAGVVDALEGADVYAFGPTRAAARIESDKEFQRRFMREEEIPGCPDFCVFDDVDAACEYLDSEDPLSVIKPAGLTGGKGVRILDDQVTRDEATEYLREREYDRVVFEEKLEGVEVTLQAFVANETVRYSPLAHDHGRAFAGDEGPNTGGMGSFTAPERLLPFVTESEYEEAVEIMDRTIDALDDFRGVLYGQFMLTSDGPKVVEYNARFGDPEAMNTIPALETNLLDVLEAAKAGEELPELSFASAATVCKYAVPEGYPTDPEAGAVVDPDDGHEGVRLYYASVEATGDDGGTVDGETIDGDGEAAAAAATEGGVETTTSRAFAYVGLGDSIVEAERRVDAAFAATDLDGLRVRHDIAKPQLLEDRRETMAAIRDPERN